MQTFAVRQVLLKKQAELEDLLTQLCHDLNAEHQARLQQPFANNANENSLEQKTLTTLRALKRVKHALNKVGHHSYGSCRRCGQPIGTQRLNVFPDIDTCLSCAKHDSH